MNAREIQSLAEAFHYWDSRVLKLQCDYFADEVELIHEDEEEWDVRYHFTGCYKTIFEHVWAYEKFAPSKDLSIGQIPHFMQDVEVQEIEIENIRFIQCKINIFPLYLEITCKDIMITKIPRDSK